MKQTINTMGNALGAIFLGSGLSLSFIMNEPLSGCKDLAVSASIYALLFIFSPFLNSRKYE